MRLLLYINVIFASFWFLRTDMIAAGLMQYKKQADCLVIPPFPSSKHFTVLVVINADVYTEFIPWGFYKMVPQNMLRTYEVKYGNFREKKRFWLLFRCNLKGLQQIEIPDLIHMCAL